MKSNYVISPVMKISNSDNNVWGGYGEIREAIKLKCTQKKNVIVVECYPGVDQQELIDGLKPTDFSLIINSDELAFEPEKMDDILSRDMTDDRVFGNMTNRVLGDYFYQDRIKMANADIDSVKSGNVLIYGVGASLVSKGGILIVADITRWEIQLRYRKGLNNWRTALLDQPKLAKYKRGFFAEWRWADRQKRECLPDACFYLDMTVIDNPIMTTGENYLSALKKLAHSPFRMTPYFDPGVWGGNWMKTNFNLPENGSNYAWSFDGVPEENSISLGFGEKVIQTPAINLVLSYPKPLLGDRVYSRFGAEFPIRFDLLDTVNGQNLSLQVHPLTDYIQSAFNMRYTQDESYYILDALGDDTNVWLGLKAGIDKSEMECALYSAQDGNDPFEAEKFVNKIPVKKHDHVLIPAGTVHCSGSNTMVLEISATPYIFTFKLWDWGRMDIDGKPRPIHIEHGMKNIQWNRDTQWVQNNLINRETIVHSDECCTVEKTGLHELEFIDTFRINTSNQAVVKRNGSVHMLNLVEGSSAVIESPDNDFEPFEVHYAETFILPQAAGEYIIKSPHGEPVKVLLACVK